MAATNKLVYKYTTNAQGRIVSLRIQHNLKHTRGIARWAQLQQLDLSGNSLTEIDDNWGALTKLQALNLKGNQISSISQSIAKLTGLRKLNLSGNRITKLPDEIESLQNLEELDLSGNQLTELPANLLRLKNIKTLRLDGNPVPPNQMLDTTEAATFIDLLKMRRDKARQALNELNPYMLKSRSLGANLEKYLELKPNEANGEVGKLIAAVNTMQGKFKQLGQDLIAHSAELAKMEQSLQTGNIAVLLQLSKGPGPVLSGRFSNIVQEAANARVRLLKLNNRILDLAATVHPQATKAHRYGQLDKKA